MKIEELDSYLISLPKKEFDNENTILDICKKIQALNINSKLERKWFFESLFERLSMRILYNKVIILQVMSFEPSIINYISNELKKDKDIILECIKNNGSPETAYSFTVHPDLYDEDVSDMERNYIQPLLKDRSFLLECIKYKPYYIKLASQNDLENYNFIKGCLSSYPKIITFLPYELQIKEEFLDIVLSQNEPIMFSFVCEDYPFREKVINSLISRKIENVIDINMSKEEIFKYSIQEIYGEDFTNDILYYAIKRENEINDFLKNINDLSKELEDYTIEIHSKNYNVMISLLSVRGLNYFGHIAENLLLNVNFILETIKMSNNETINTIIYSLPIKNLLNKKIIFELFKKGYSLSDFLDEQLDRKDVIHYAKNNNVNLDLLKNNLLEDIQLILFEIHKEDNIYNIFKIYEQLSDGLKKNKMVVIKVLKKMDKQTCIENENFILNLDNSLKNDIDVAQEIILISPYYLSYLSHKIRDNKILISKACHINSSAIKQATIKRQFLNLFGL